MKTMTIKMQYDFPKGYNDGNKAEYAFSMHILGYARKLDNVPAYKAGDVLDYQVKSSHASVCKGTNLQQHLQNDKANHYAYVCSDGTVYIMSKTEYATFVNAFSSIERDSKKNGGAEKIRLKHESNKMLRWLEERV